jgi:diketogulonate reductase-like aldo/keto reductase
MKICGKEVSPIGLGTWKMGGGFFTPEYDKDDLYVSIIRYAIKRGINIIDTAEMYGGGHAEEIVGKAIKDFNREDIVVVTKVWPTHLRYNDVINSAKESLKRLSTSYIDLYAIHWPNPEVDLEETITAMEKLVEEGIVRCVGVSNFNVELLKEAQKYYKIEANEIEYNVLHLDPEKDVIPYCENNGIKVIAYSPLAQGRVLSYKRVLDLAKKYNRKPAQIALNYLIKRSIPIPKASSIEHVNEIIDSWNFSLDKKDIAFLRA